MKARRKALKWLERTTGCLISIKCNRIACSDACCEAFRKCDGFIALQVSLTYTFVIQVSIASSRLSGH